MPSCGRFISEDPIGWASGQTNDYAYVGGDPVGFNDPDGRIAIVPALLIIGGTVWAAWQGYQAGQEYGQMECATKKKFDDRASNPENWTEAQNGARAAEQVSNGMSTFGPFVLKGAIGVALAGAGGSFVGAGFALTGATVGFMAGKADYTCQ